jgi:hypothetical protein
MAQGLQSISNLNEGTDWTEQTELKELETHLSLYPASNLNAAFLRRTSPTLINSLLNYGFVLFKTSPCLPAITKEWANRRRYKIRYPILGGFIAAVSKIGIHGDKACLIGVNLLEVS